MLDNNTKKENQPMTFSVNVEASQGENTCPSHHPLILVQIRRIISENEIF